jgi:hypothetical protein
MREFETHTLIMYDTTGRPLIKYHTTQYAVISNVFQLLKIAREGGRKGFIEVISKGEVEELYII